VLTGAPQVPRSDGDQHSFCSKIKDKEVILTRPNKKYVYVYICRSMATVHDKRKNTQLPLGVAEETNKFVDGVIHISCICSIYLFLPRVVILPSYNSLDSIETTGRETGTGREQACRGELQILGRIQSINKEHECILSLREREEGNRSIG